MSGNKGRKPIARAEGGTPISQRLPPPPHLGAYGKQEWRRILPKLAGVANDVDYSALAAYCSAYQTMIQADLVLQSEGIMLYDDQKGVIAHPATRVKAQAMDQVRRYQTEFGLTPLARLRVQPAPQEEEDDLEKMT